jgi:TatD DNase family protein
VAELVLLDAHCHVDRFDDPPALLRSARDAGVGVVAVTELPSSFQRLKMLLSRLPGTELALGLHPLRAHRNTRLELTLFDRLVSATRWVGEVGLDLSADGRATTRAQTAAFEHILDHAAMQEKVLSIHSRGAARETVEMLRHTAARGVLHWYSGAIGPLDDALGLGTYFSINSAMLASKAGMRVVAAVPRERVLLETDGPHVKYKGRSAEPSDVPHICADLAGAWGLTPSEAAAQIIANARRLLDGPEPTSAQRVRHASPRPAGNPLF